MIWDILNAMIATAGGIITDLEAASLQPSPIFLDGAQVTAVGGVVGYAAFFLPVAAIAVTLGLFMIGVLAWIGVMWLIQFIEFVTP